MFLSSLWRRFLDTDSRAPRAARRQRAQHGARRRLTVQPLEERRLLSIEPAGTEFLVNTTTAGSQAVVRSAMDADGDFVLTWAAEGQDGSGLGVFAQRYNSAGVPQGDEFRVNTYTASWQNNAGVASDDAGNLIIAWDTDQDGSGMGVFAQRYNALGEEQGAEFRVNSETLSAQTGAVVAMADDGEFVIAWQSFDQDGSVYGVYAQAYDAAGAPHGEEFRVNTHTAGTQHWPAVAMDSGGDFVVAWQSHAQDGSDYGVYARRFADIPAAPTNLTAAATSDTRIDLEWETVPGATGYAIYRSEDGIDWSTSPLGSRPPAPTATPRCWKTSRSIIGSSL
jgi:hypothetical protein